MRPRTNLLSAILFVVLVIGHSPAQTPRNRLTPEQWREDLRQLIAELETRHADLYGNISREAFTREAEKISAKIPSLTDEQILFELARLTVLIGDGHTGIFLPFDRENGFRRYPIEVFPASDGWLIISSAPEYKHLIGSKIRRIEETEIDKVRERLIPIMPRDNSYMLDAFFALFMVVPEALRGAGVAKNIDELEIMVEEPDARLSSHVLRPVDRASKIDWQFIRPRSELPLWLKRRSEKFWLTYIADKKAVYVQFNSADIGIGEPEAQFVAFTNELTKVVAANKAEKLIIDLRWNSGGNTTRTRHLLYSIIKSDAINQRGRLFTITSPTTYSAGVWHTIQLEQHTPTLFVGLPTGGRPNHSGELRRFRLPNSRAEVRYSAVYKHDSDPADHRPAVVPDLLTPISSEDYLNGRDPALEAIFNYRSKSQIADVLRKLIAEQGIKTAVTEYRRSKQEDYNQYDFGVLQLETLASELRRAGKLSDAIELYKLNAAEFPYSPLVYDSLGRALMESGDDKAALENFEKAFSLDKRYTQSLDMIRELKKRLGQKRL